MKVFTSRKFPVKSWCNEPEAGAIAQALDLASHPCVFKHVALMPDTHQGYGMPIGGVAAMEGAISPNCVGVDIACGMMACKTNIKASSLDAQKLKDIVHSIKRSIPMGMRHQNSGVKYRDFAAKIYAGYDKSKSLAEGVITEEAIAEQLGTLGSGNHFIELQSDEDGDVWIMIHSGSRNIGKRICDVYNKIALGLCGKWHSAIPNKDLAFLPVDSSEGKAYLNDMNLCMEFSFENRRCMLVEILSQMNHYVGEEVYSVEVINIHHNYAAIEHHFGRDVWVHRKGATRARLGELGIIPGSMGSASYIVRGLGNEQSFQSCSHGAGRAMSRKAATGSISIEDFKKSMLKVVSEDVDSDHIDESPMAYKDISTVISEQSDLVEMVHSLKPLANCKG